MDGKRHYSNYFFVYFDGERKIQPPRLLSLFLFDVEDPARNQKLNAEMMRKLKKGIHRKT